MNPLPEIPEDVLKAAMQVSRWMAEQGHKKWELFDLCSRNHATELEFANAKLATLSRLIDLARNCDDAKSEAKLAASASFSEALAYTNSELLEKELDEWKAVAHILHHALANDGIQANNPLSNNMRMTALKLFKSKSK